MGHSIKEQHNSTGDEFYYFHTLSQRLCLLALTIHTAFSVIYNTLDISALAMVNAISVGIYFAALKLNLHNRFGWAWTLINFQILSYAVISLLCIGSTGERDMLMFLPMLFFLYPVSFGKRLTYLMFIAVFYAGLAFAAMSYKPLYELNHNIFTALNIGMGATIIFVLAYFIYYTYRAITLKESALKNDNQALRHQYEEMEKRSVTDVLTGLYNRQKLEQVLSYEIERSSRYNTTFSVILIDIDNFKKINDTHGHTAGDRVLAEFAKVLADKVRTADLAGRWGGEEFMVICPETDGKGAAVFAEKLRIAIAKHKFPDAGHVTASFGTGAYTRGVTAEVFVDHVDTALYQSKDAGRNRVTASKEMKHNATQVLRVVS